MSFQYFCSREAEQFTFYRIPKILFTDRRFSKISIEAKVLYGLLLDRMSLSLKNQWIDGADRVYIYFKLLELMTEVICSKKTSISVGGEPMPTSVVKSRLLKLDSSHVEYVLDALRRNTSKIHNIRSYLLTALYATVCIRQIVLSLLVLKTRQMLYRRCAILVFQNVLPKDFIWLYENSTKKQFLHMA